MRGRDLCGRAGMWLAAALVMFALAPATSALAPATALASASSATQTATSHLPCPPAPLPPVAGCTNGSGGSGSGGSGNKQARAIPSDQVLSNEMSFTEFAYVRRIANVYGEPSTRSRSISRLQWYTEDGFSSIYVLLRSHWTSPRTEWIKIRIPGRPNGRTGWVERNALGRFHMTHTAVVVNRETERISVYENGRRIWSAPVGVGAPGMPTPTGHFWLNEFFNLASQPSNGYYPYAFGTTDYSTLTDWPGGGVVGIHGPYGAPASAIPGRISHGCIRLRIPDDFWFGRHVKLGTPVRVV